MQIPNRLYRSSDYIRVKHITVSTQHNPSLSTMPAQVHHLDSSFELPLEKLMTYLDTDPEYPGGITTLTPERRNSTLLLKSESEDESIGNYTPTCQLRATVTEKRIFEDGNGRGGWSAPDEDRESELIDYACFNGKQEDVLQNTALQHPMFEVLCTLAEQATCGTLKAIVLNDDSLDTVYIEDGEPVESQIDIVRSGDHCDDDDENGVDWAQNDYIES